MSLDEKALQGLTEQSGDAQSDAMKSTAEPLAEMVELGHETRRGGGFDPAEVQAFDESRRRFLSGTMTGTGVLAATGFNGALMALFKSPAFADQALDIQILQTAASIENLAVATYDTASTLPFIGGPEANAVLRQFVTETRKDHAEHALAINATLKSLGGPEQNAPNPVLLQVVDQAKPGLTGPAQVVDLAIQLEDAATQTYVASTGSLVNPQAKRVAASIMGVEAQHVAILNAVKALLAANAPNLIALPPNVGQLPASAGTVGFPDTFYKTNLARKPEEGAIV